MHAMKAFVFSVFLAAVSLLSTVTARLSSPLELRNSLDDSSDLLLRRHRRGIPANYATNVSVQIFTNSTHACDMGLTHGGVRIQLEYRSVTLDDGGGIEYFSSWNHLEYLSVPSANTTSAGTIDINDETFIINLNTATSIRWIQFRLRQLEHGGGQCNCWSTCYFRVGDISVDFSIDDNQCHVQLGETRELQRSDSSAFQTCPTRDNGDTNQLQFTFCGGSASLVRGIISKVINLDTSMNPPSEGTGDTVRTVFQPSCPTDNQLVNVEDEDDGPTGCNEAQPRIDIRFQLRIGLPGCDRPDHRDEGVEVSFGNWNGNGEWIPIHFYAPNNNNTPSGQKIVIGGANGTHIDIRGYNVSYTVGPTSTSTVTQSLSMCDEELLRREGAMQFRWLQTVWQVNQERDMWSLDNVRISLWHDNMEQILIEKGFETPNDTLWNIRGGRWLNNSDAMCSITDIPMEDGGRIVFGLEEPIFPRSINSRFISTTPVDVRTLLEGVPTTTISPRTNVEETESTETTVGFVDPRLELLRLEEERVLNIIFEDAELFAVYISSPVEAAELLEEVLERRFDSDVDIDETVVVYLLGTIFNNASNANITDQEFSESIVEIASGILTRTDHESNVTDTSSITGSTLLRQLDNFALNVFDNDTPIFSDMIEHHVMMDDNDDSDEDDLVSVIQVEGTEIMLPRQLLKMFIGQGLQPMMRVGSFFYRNMSGLLPETQRDVDDTQLGSAVISTALQCENEPGRRCSTENLMLNQPVRITITHTEAIKKLIEASNTTEVTCVFWEFFEGEGNSILSTGDWSTTGCTRNDNLSTSAVTVCECNHLTHFAILLSATGTRFSDPVTLSLQIIGYIGVSISLVAMAITVAIFIFFKSLRSMRSFIHINLCINLIIAQLIFVVGIEPRLGDDETHVPVGCQVVAVLLHYFFLVSFMWMLMEGVVLYVVLVRVFVKYQKRYIIAFTVTSYGLPLLYMGALTLPLGFALPGVSGYGYLTACFLNPDTKFIWAFIVPVIVIILANIGFFIMAMTIMFRHQRRQTNKSTVKNVKHWLKASASLLVVMGITWLMGLLVLSETALLPFAYIFTILVAFQGVFIFVLFVIFSEQVQEARSKWWRSKVSESEFLSKHFGENSITSSTRMTGMKSVPSSAMEKSSHEAPSTPGIEKGSLTFELGQSTKLPVDNDRRDPAAKPEDKKGSLQTQGTTFEVILVPAGSLENLADNNCTHYDDGGDKPDSLTNGNLVNRPTAVPNDYQNPSEFIRPNSTTNNTHQT